MFISINITAQDVSWMDYISPEKIEGIDLKDTSLTAIKISNHNADYESVDGVLYDKHKTILLYYPRARKKKLACPNTVKYIAKDALSDQPNLTSITFGDSIREIDFKGLEEKSFGENIHYYLSNLTTLNVSNGNLNYSSYQGAVYTKDKSKLLYCPLKKTGKLVIHHSTKELDNFAFRISNRLTSIYIPDSLTQLVDKSYHLLCTYSSRFLVEGESEYAAELVGFYYCIGLKKIEVSKRNPFYSSKDGILYNKDKTNLIYCPRAKEGRVVLPPKVKKISAGAFSYCNRITSIVLNDSVVLNGSYPCFYKNMSLSSIQVSVCNPYYSSENGILYNKDKTEIKYFPQNIQGDVYFSNNLQIIPKLSVEERVWGRNSTIHITKGIKRICEGAFIAYCGKVKFEHPNSVKYISCFLSTETEIDSISLDSVKTIQERSICGNKFLKSVIITSDSLIEIKPNTFMSSSTLTNVLLPKSITKIGLEAFKDCKSLKTFTIAAPTPVPLTEDAKVFEGVTLSRCILRVPKGTAPAYRTAPVWKNFGHIVEME